MNMTETVMVTNADPRFYQLVGPFLARREVVRELGGHMWDDDGKTWTVAVEDGKAAAFLATAPGPHGTVKVQSCYAVNGREDLIPALIAEAVKAAAPSPLTAVVRTSRTAPWAAAGFEPVGAKGGFTTLARKAR